MCDHCHSLVDFALSGCVKSWTETMEGLFSSASGVLESGLSNSKDN